PHALWVSKTGLRMGYAARAEKTGFGREGVEPYVGLINSNDRTRAMTFFVGSWAGDGFGFVTKKFIRPGWAWHTGQFDLKEMCRKVVTRWAGEAEQLDAAVAALERQQMTPERAILLSTRFAHRWGGRDNKYGFMTWTHAQKVIKEYERLVSE